MPTAYKILTTPQFAALAQNTFAGAPVDIADGYIHLSTAEQVAETALKHFAGQENLVIAAVELTGLPIKWEASRGGALFPHLYGPLTMAAITAYGPLRDENGLIKLPG